MKKLLIALFIVLIPVSVLATDMTVSSCVINKQPEWRTKQQIFEVKLTLETDGTDQAEFAISSHCSQQGVMDFIEGGLLYEVEIAPGTTAPDAAYTVTFDNEKGADILSAAVTTGDSQSQVFYPVNRAVVFDVQVDFPDVGDSGDDIFLYLKIMR